MTSSNVSDKNYVLTLLTNVKNLKNWNIFKKYHHSGAKVKKACDKVSKTKSKAFFKKKMSIPT